MKICKKCNAPFQEDKIGRLCDRCRLARNRELYQQRKIKKKCKQCGNPFDGKKWEHNCKKCFRKRKPILQEFLQKIVCPNCYTILEFKPKKITKGHIEYLAGSVCFKCKEVNKIKQSEKMMGDRNPSVKKYGRAKIKKRLSKEEVKKLHSERMKKNNPMKNEKISKKVSYILKKKYATGEIKSKRGPAHWNYKGNKKHFITKIRSRLYKEWIYPIMTRDNFKCVYCKKSGQLEVHHLIPLRELIRLCLKNRQIHELDDNEFEELKNCVVKSHHLDDGITLCLDCHRNIDLYRR